MGLYPGSFLPVCPCAFSLTLSSSASQQMAALPGLWAISRWGRGWSVLV